MKYRDELIATARAIVRPGMGILAADESTGTIGQRFATIGVENTEANRVAYRELLVMTPGIEEYISGFLMFEETLKSTLSDGRKMAEVIKEKGMIAGIKVDKGVKTIMGTLGETAT